MRSLLNILHRKSGDLCARSSVMVGKSGVLAAGSDDMGGKSGDMAAESDDFGGKSGNFFGRSGDIAAKSGDMAAKSGDMAEMSGVIAAESGDSFGKSGDMAAKSDDMAEMSGVIAAVSCDSLGKSGDMAAGSGGMGRMFRNFFSTLGSRVRQSFDLRAAWERMKARHAQRQAEFDAMFHVEYSLYGNPELADMAEMFPTSRRTYNEAHAILDLEAYFERPRLQPKIILAVLLALARTLLGLWHAAVRSWPRVAFALRVRAAGSPQAPRAPPVGAFSWSIC